MTRRWPTGLRASRAAPRRLRGRRRRAVCYSRARGRSPSRPRRPRGRRPSAAGIGSAFARSWAGVLCLQSKAYCTATAHSRFTGCRWLVMPACTVAWNADGRMRLSSCQLFTRSGPHQVASQPPRWLTESFPVYLFQRIQPNESCYCPNHGYEAGVLLTFVVLHYQRLFQGTSSLSSRTGFQSSRVQTACGCWRACVAAKHGATGYRSARATILGHHSRSCDRLSTLTSIGLGKRGRRSRPCV